MPNQRAENKKQFTAALERDLLDKLDALAERLDVSRTEVLARAARNFLSEYAAAQKEKEQQEKQD